MLHLRALAGRFVPSCVWLGRFALVDKKDGIRPRGAKEKRRSNWNWTSQCMATDEDPSRVQQIKVTCGVHRHTSIIDLGVLVHAFHRCYALRTCMLNEHAGMRTCAGYPIYSVCLVCKSIQEIWIQLTLLHHICATSLSDSCISAHAYGFTCRCCLLCTWMVESKAGGPALNAIRYHSRNMHNAFAALICS